MEDFRTATVFERFALNDILAQVPEELLGKAIDLLESDAVHIRFGRCHSVGRCAACAATPNTAHNTSITPGFCHRLGRYLSHLAARWPDAR